MHTKASIILKKFGSLYTWDSQWLSFLKKNPQYIVSSHWTDPWRQKYPELYPLLIEHESTYDGCVKTEFDLNPEGGIIVSVLIYNGDTYNGARTDLRCTFVAILQDMPEFSAHFFKGVVRKQAIRELEKQAEAEYEAKIATEITLLLMED